MEYIVKDYETRYFAGIEYEGGVKVNQPHEIPKLWDTLFHTHLNEITNRKEPFKFIGLECYPPDIQETNLFDYYALIETNGLIEESGSIVTKKLPKGKYISFPIQFDDIHNEIQKVYKYVKDNDMKINRGFDFEDYLVEQNYNEKGAILHFSFLLKE